MTTGVRGRASPSPRIPEEPVVQAKSHSMADPGGLAVLLIVVIVFLTPAAAWIVWAPAPAAGIGQAIEIRMLVWGAILSLLLPLIQIAIHIRRFGGPMVRGNRDNFPTIDGVTARVSRAHTNLVESLLPFAAAVLSAHALGVSNRLTVAASVMYLAARVLHAVSYILGITVIRSAAFYAGLIATLAIAAELRPF